MKELSPKIAVCDHSLDQTDIETPTHCVSFFQIVWPRAGWPALSWRRQLLVERADGSHPVCSGGATISCRRCLLRCQTRYGSCIFRNAGPRSTQRSIASYAQASRPNACLSPVMSATFMER